MDRVIVTGASGFIGHNLVQKLLTFEPGCIILVSNTASEDNYPEKSNFEGPIISHIADIRDKNEVTEIFQRQRADTCVHLAAKISVANSIKNPDETMEINEKGTLNVLDACFKSRVRNFVFASSAAVYGESKKLPITENHDLNPFSPYGTSKMRAEEHILSYLKLKKIQNAIIFRIFNVYGPGQSEEVDIISRFAGRLSKGLAPIIYGDGRQTRDFISVDDVTEAIMLAISAMERQDNRDLNMSPIFNLGTGIPTSIDQLARKMIRIFGFDMAPMNIGMKEIGEISHSYADVSKSKDILRFVPKKRIEIGLQEMYQLISDKINTANLQK